MNFKKKVLFPLILYETWFKEGKLLEYNKEVCYELQEFFLEATPLFGGLNCVPLSRENDMLYFFHWLSPVRLKEKENFYVIHIYACFNSVFFLFFCYFLHWKDKSMG